MRQAGVNPTAVAIFENYWDQLAAGATGRIAEASIAPLANPDTYDETAPVDAAGQAALAQTVIIKLNGGLGTSMGLAKAKTFLEVVAGRSFLDLLVQQVRWARQRYGPPASSAAIDSIPKSRVDPRSDSTRARIPVRLPSRSAPSSTASARPSR